ncbi:peptidoglycan-binding domain-containing protein [Streptomyces heilongjiangensis]|uniref:Peptidoglycan-binding protein n=1 Tax=Streptomyces heilongjiangensis TaxID=945052 RepID=A0ABW1B4R1_9ACTN|nr:peptidoglycan-binding protein [Streptomyces heilongjiangensis]MDC2947824.1 peptidoglycan-binding protein [Streptomyces heilongjiangensis]
MSEPTGPVCPQCGTPRTVDGTPACSCAEQASEAHRDSRTAQAAAVEDFDPVRIRPFVKVGDETRGAPDAAGAPDAVAAPDSAGSPGFHDLAYGSGDPTEELPVPAGELGPPSAPDARFATGTGRPEGGRRRKKALAVGAGAAAVAALVAAGLVSGLFSYDAPARDGALPDDVRARLPESASQEDTAPTPTPSGTASPSRSTGTPSGSPDATPSESPATPSGSADPTRTPSNSGATSASGPTPSGSAEQNPVLGPGDQGPEVTELQLRLRQVGLYSGEADGEYDRDVESAVRGYQFTRIVLDDESGVYGLPTRTALESETSEP